MRASPQPPDRWSVFDLTEGFHLASAVTTLHELGILSTLAAQPSTADALARRYRLDRAALHGVLEYVAARTDVIRRKGPGFAATRGYQTEARFLLDLYTGAFGPNAARLPEILRNDRLGERVVDRARHARAFARAIGTRDQPVASVIRRLGIRHVLDLGCGSGDLLVQLAAADRSFTGCGIEMNPLLCRAARARIRTARLTRQIRVIGGDSRRIGTLLPRQVRARVTGVTACHVVNETFRSGISVATDWLRRIRRTLPGRPVVINDYYGRLGTSMPGADRHTLLHDYAQLISGQGIPPPKLREWQTIYAAADYRLVEVFEDRVTTQFIHVLV
jgi:SAM-dependent methyltransferase